MSAMRRLGGFGSAREAMAIFGCGRLFAEE